MSLLCRRYYKINSASSKTLKSIALIGDFILCVPIIFLHRMFGHVVVDNDVLFRFYVRAIPCDYGSLALFELSRSGTRILACYFVRVISDDPLFTETYLHFY